MCSVVVYVYCVVLCSAASKIMSRLTYLYVFVSMCLFGVLYYSYSIHWIENDGKCVFAMVVSYSWVYLFR